MCHVSGVTPHVSLVTCHMSHVTRHVSPFSCQFFFFFYEEEKNLILKHKLDNVVELVGGGSVIKGPTPSTFKKSSQ